MKFRKMYLTLAAVALCALGGGATIALASGDSDDTLPKSKTFVATSTTATTFTAVGGAVVSCPIGKSVLEFTTNAGGESAQIDNLTNQTFGPGCTVTGGVGATVTTAGTWKLTYSDNRAEKEPAPTDESLGNNDDLTLIVPKEGATITIPATGCVLKIAPTNEISVEAAYNDETGVATVTDAQVPYSSNGVGIGCPAAGAGEGAFNGTYKLAGILADASINFNWKVNGKFLEKGKERELKSQRPSRRPDQDRPLYD